MPIPDRDAHNPDDAQQEPLALNKETLGELDVEPHAADQVKGGRYPSEIFDVISKAVSNATRKTGDK